MDKSKFSNELPDELYPKLNDEQIARNAPEILEEVFPLRHDASVRPILSLRKYPSGIHSRLFCPPGRDAGDRATPELDQLGRMLLNFAGRHRGSARRSVLISTAALKEPTIAIPAAVHNTIR